MPKEESDQGAECAKCYEVPSSLLQGTLSILHPPRLPPPLPRVPGEDPHRGGGGEHVQLRGAAREQEEREMDISDIGKEGGAQLAFSLNTDNDSTTDCDITLSPDISYFLLQVFKDCLLVDNSPA